MYRFGKFRLDPAARELWRGSEELMLPLKVFECIAYLIENRDRAIGRDELIAAVWGDTDASDNVLGQAIRHARHVLGDSGDDQQVIKTIRGFGYRWVMALETVPDRGSPVAMDIEALPAARGYRRHVAWLLIGMVIFGVGGIGMYLLHSVNDPVPSPPDAAQVEGEIALLLPVVVEEAVDHTWVRLGVMDLIAERLRAAGQAMVPSDTVIRLLQDGVVEPDAKQIRELMAATSAGLILSAHARMTGTRWTVSVRSVHGSEPVPSAVGEAHDILEAARIAADRMSALLGLAPADGGHDNPDLQTLLQKVEAARLAQQMDVARALIEDAAPALQQHAEVLFQWARIEFYSHDLDAAQDTLESLLQRDSVARDPVLQARILNGLAAVYASRGERDDAAPLLAEAVRSLAGRDTLEVLGTAHMNLGVLQQESGDVDAARVHMAQARRIFQGIGDVQRLATLDFNLGALEGRREHYAAALRHFESAAERHAALRDVGGELLARAHMIHAHLLLLDLQAAAALESDMRELLAKTANPAIIARANLSRIHLLEAQGRREAANALLDEILADTEGRSDIQLPRMGALTLLAERALREGDAGLTERIASGVIAALENERNEIQGNVHGLARLVQVRARLAGGGEANASDTALEMAQWARQGDIRSAKIYADLAAAEVAAAQGRSGAAERYYERALARGEHMPLHLLQIAESYVPWLLARGATTHTQRALFVADLFADHADRYYDAALLQLRVYHVLGPPSAWRAALERATSLAGERRIPQELLAAP